jgi:hypothetical protein
VTTVLTERTARVRGAPFRPGRALRLEIKRSAAVWVLPVLAALFYFNAYRTAAGYPPTWTLRALVITSSNLVFFSVIAAGIAAWVATREGRRKTGDLLATTARAAWARQVTVLAATAFWMVLAYLAGVAVIYLQTARQATWGGPPLWPVAVGVVGVAASCAVGFACGTLLPGRFTAPIVAVAVFAAWFTGVNAANSVNPNDMNDLSRLKGTSALLVPVLGRPSDVDLGVYYRVLSDVSIAQVMFMGGVLFVMVGLLALVPAGRVPGVRELSFASGRQLTVVAAAVVACGVAASATAFSLAGTGRYSLTTGWEIPALHDAADDQPVPYTLDCTGSVFKGGAFTVCIHPAFAPYLGAMSAALQPAAAEIAGLPGAPVRAEMTMGNALPAVAGSTAVYDYSTEDDGFGEESFWATPAMARAADWEQGVQQDFITWFVSGPAEQDSSGPTPADEAVAIALLAKIGTPVPPGYPQFSQPGTQSGGSSASNTPGASGTPPQASAAQITAAATRLESLPSAARRAWLAANIAGLRSGAVTLAQLP